MTNKRVKTGCPYCAGLKPSKENNILGNIILMTEWDYNKNKLKPEDMTNGKGVKVWWKCKKGHEWEASIVSRAKRGCGCPYCRKPHSLLEVRVYAELKKLFPKTEWCPSVNGFEIDVFLRNYNLGIEIDGNYWHENKYQKDINKNKELEKIGIKIIRVRINPLKKINDYDINSDYKDEHIDILLKLFLNLYKITRNDKFLGYIKDKKIINNIYYEKKVSEISDINKSLFDVRPEICDEWNCSKNGFLKPENVSYGSGRKVWWKCKNNHEWKTEVKNRSAGGDCPYCRGRYPSETHNLLVLYPELVRNYWCYDLNDKNPEEFSPATHQYAWWKNDKGEKKKMRISEIITRYKKKIKRNGQIKI